jgi:hypothetical protein
MTEADLLVAMSNDELELVRDTALANKQADPIAAAILHVVNLIRGFIAANPTNKLGADGALPESLIPTAADLLVVRLPSRISGLSIDIGDVRKAAATKADALLRDVARGVFYVEDPETDDESTDSPTDVAPLMNDKDLLFSQTQQDGI